MGRQNEVAGWINERDAMRVRKEDGATRPWTGDRILRMYRFCNVRREDDRVTRWISEHWRNPYAGASNLVTALTIARLINWPPTLAELGFPSTWDRGHFTSVVRARAKRGEKVWTSAYMVTTCGSLMDKADYVASIIDIVSRNVDGLRPRASDTLADMAKRFNELRGLGSFLAAQVVADLKYVEPLRHATDWETWCAPGPGSLRGISIYFGYIVRPQQFRDRIATMIEQVGPQVTAEHPPEHAQDWQNVMCEFGKYSRAKDGIAAPRQLYRPCTAF